MSLTVVWGEGGGTLAMGSPGASRIATTILQGWVRFGLEKMHVEDMVSAPRLHVENIDEEFVLQYEPGIDVSLAAEHFKLRSFSDKDMYFGALNVAGQHPDAAGRRQERAQGVAASQQPATDMATCSCSSELLCCRLSWPSMRRNR
jgi:gamma-glutamyltranspeptidase